MILEKIKLNLQQLKFNIMTHQRRVFELIKKLGEFVDQQHFLDILDRNSSFEIHDDSRCFI